MSELSIDRPRPMTASNTMSAPRAAVALGIGALAILPLLLSSTVGLTIGMQVMVLAVFAYSYQLLFGLANLLSFGHAVYFGIGAFLAAHTMNSAALAQLGLPVEAVPLVGLLGGGLVGIVLGFPTSRSSGTPFAMVTLGIGELVGACFLMFPAAFGGESGITTDRSALSSVFGGYLATTRQIYPIILAWTLLLIGLALWIRYTPLGLLARAVRNNAERVGFLGFNPTTLRFRMIILSAMLASAAGAMSAMVYEIVSVEAVSMHNSANVLIATVVGGAGHAVGPLLGAALLTFMQTVLPNVTSAWPMYYGLVFTAIILGAPNGLIGLLDRVHLKSPKPALALLLRAAGAIVAIEWLYRVREGEMPSEVLLYLAPIVSVLAFVGARAITTGFRRAR